MTSSPSEMPPQRVIRVMLKMSFFNECLSSLNIQDSNALYAYTRCLEYYSRVQDFCLSLFSDMKEKNHEEIRQILSIVNYKIVLYSLLIQNTKGVAQTYRKITGCIHAMSAILSAGRVPARSLRPIDSPSSRLDVAIGAGVARVPFPRVRSVPRRRFLSPKSGSFSRLPGDVSSQSRCL